MAATTTALPLPLSTWEATVGEADRWPSTILTGGSTGCLEVLVEVVDAGVVGFVREGAFFAFDMSHHSTVPLLTGWVFANAATRPRARDIIKAK